MIPRFSSVLLFAFFCWSKLVLTSRYVHCFPDQALLLTISLPLLSQLQSTYPFVIVLIGILLSAFPNILFVRVPFFPLNQALSNAQPMSLQMPFSLD